MNFDIWIWAIFLVLELCLANKMLVGYTLYCFKQICYVSTTNFACAGSLKDQRKVWDISMIKNKKRATTKIYL